MFSDYRWPDQNCTCANNGELPRKEQEYCGREWSRLSFDPYNCRKRSTLIATRRAQVSFCFFLSPIYNETINEYATNYKINLCRNT